jgi:hypothetical protein
MSYEVVPPSSQPPDPPRGRPAPGRDQSPRDLAWLRPTLLFLLGLLVGTLVISATRPPPTSQGQPTDGTIASTDNQSCDHVIAGAQHLADLASRAAHAAENHDATSLTSLVRELNATEKTLDIDVTGCHR